MRIFLGLILSCVLLLSACGGEQAVQSDSLPPEIEKLVEEVMEIHDEVMPEIETMQSMKERLQAMQKAGKGDAAKTSAALKALEVGDDAMMDWMRNFKMPSPSSEQTKEELTTYLQKEKSSISTVAEQMRSSMKMAEEILGQNK